MAVGFPAKTNFATGDVLTATNMNDITGTLNLLESAQFAAGKNRVLNSAFQIWQRGTSVAGATAVNYTADQWQLFRAGSTISRQATGDTTNLPNIQYCGRVQRNSGTTGTSSILLSQSFETANSIPYAGKTVTLSFYARKGANFSQASSQIGYAVYTGTGTDQSYISGFTGVATAFSGAATLTSTWQRFTFTGSIASTATEIAVNFSYEPVGTAGANDYFEITGVQLEAASTASPFQTASGSIGGELALCQRYYYRLVAGTANGVFGIGQAVAASGGYALVAYPVPMRVSATTLEQTGTASNYAVFNASSSLVACSVVPSIVSGYTTVSGAFVNFSVASGLVAGNAATFAANSSATAYLGFSAEL